MTHQKCNSRVSPLAIMSFLIRVSFLLAAFDTLNVFATVQAMSPMLPTVTLSDLIAPAHPAEAVTLASDQVVITKEALSSLVNTAAQHQNLEQVLSSGPKLPIVRPKSVEPTVIPLELSSQIPEANSSLELSQPASTVAVLMPSARHQTQKSAGVSAQNNQSCLYQNQTYSLGQTLQSDKGWMRCSATITFDSNGAAQYGNAVWTLRDSAL